MGSEGVNDEGFVVLSKVRVGLKREFQFAMRSQNEIVGSLSRTRVRRRVNESSNPNSVFIKEERESDVEEQAKSDVVDVTSDGVVVESERMREKDNNNDKVTDCDGNFDGVVEDVRSDVVVSGCDGGVMKKVVAVPSKLKELLETGLLEGLNVKYIRGSKSGQASNGLAGVIKGTGILCFCEECKGDEVVTPSVFELHAGSANKRPTDYIHLENGKTIRDVLNACKFVNLNSVSAVILNAISSLPQEELVFCRGCREPIADGGSERITLLCSSCSELDVSQTTSKQATNTSKETERSVERVPLQRTCNIAPKSHPSSSLRSQGKLTRKDMRLHRLVFEDDFLPDGTELGYYANKKRLLVGYKKDSGIFCECCRTVVSPSQFEAHAGCASRRKPYLQIYTSNGASLHEIAVKISKECKFSTDENDDLCNICQGDGNLLCCDGCPRAFHAKCVSLQSIPESKWYCKYCEDNFQMERHAECNPNAIAAGRVPGANPMEQITNRCIRIVNILETQDGGCALCRIQDFCRSGFGPRTVIICDQCEKEYHVGCLRENNMDDLNELPVGDWFCCSDCEETKLALKRLVELGEQKLPYDLCDVVKRKLAGDAPEKDDLDTRWRVLHGRSSCIDEIRPLLSKAVSVFHEQFDPICYGLSKQDLIPHMVYGRNLKETEFGGMYCAVLSINSTIVSAAVFRVFGKVVAEIPIVATSKGCEGKGYFQSLYSCLERCMKDMNVKSLLLPSAEETKSLWLNRFGFSEMPREEFNELRTHYSLMNFDGTSMLRKLVAASET